MTPGQEFVEVFLQEASEHLQFLREYSGILQDPYPVPDDVERLFISAHTLKGTSASYGYPHFSEVSDKLAHIFQYAMNASITPEAAGPLVEFISEAIAVLESDLLFISNNMMEAVDEIAAFKERYPFAFQQPAEPEPEPYHAPAAEHVIEPTVEAHDFVPHAEAGGEEQVLTTDGRWMPRSQYEAEVAEAQAPAAAQASATAEPSFESAQAAAEQAPVEAETPRARPAMPQRPKPAVSPESIPDLEPDGDVPAEILEFFVPEAEEHLGVVTDCLLELEANPNPDAIHRLFRAMHTVKGSAAQVGLQRIARVAHRAEDLVGRLRDGLLQPSAQIVDLCLESVDVVKKFLYRQWTDEATMQTQVKSLLARIATLAPEEAEGEEAPAEVSTSVESQAGAAVHVDELTEPVEAPLEGEAEAKAAKEIEEFVAPAGKAGAPSALPQSKSIRIALDRLDQMMNAVGELVINRTRMLGRVAELERLADVLNFSKARMSDKIVEFQEKHEFGKIGAGIGAPQPPQYNEYASLGGVQYPFSGGYSSYAHGYDHSLAEFSDLEMDKYDDFNILSRSLTEISADITEVLTQLDGFVRRVDSDIDEFTKLAHRLQDEITQARMVPIGNLYTRISRAVRDAAKASNKQVELALEGADTELDNNIIQQIADPLMHLVRNSVAHGLEKPEDRYHAGKSEMGNVAVRAYHRGNHIYIEVEDDGRGIDYEGVRAKAVENGLVGSEDAATLNERQLLEFLFHPGFSTASRKTELAGRGVGLDVVRSNIEALNGEIEIDTEKNKGTRFTLKVPLTLIISQALFVRCGESLFAFPLAFVEEIRRLKVDEIEEVGGKLLTKVRDVVTEVVRLDSHLGIAEVQPVNGYLRMVIVNVGGRQVGIVVEDVVRKDEIVIKNLGEYMRNVKMFPGATIAPDGSLILLIDVNRLVMGEAVERRPLSMVSAAARIFSPGAAAIAHGTIPEQAIDEVKEEKVVLLADDSISVRKFVGRMLEKAGYRVKLASDGLEALEIATQTKIDMIVTDLEMPRTNGYELMAHLRQSPQTRHIPVMVVTSRAGAKHKERALKEGASAFMVKPVQEDQFVAEVTALIGGSSRQEQVVTQ
jgi:chemosensory pili system protein ChpA (sensor histidine kinase/response regulator)